MSQSIGSSIGYSRKRIKRLKRPSLGLNRYIITTPVTNVTELRSISVTPVFSCITERLVMRDFFLPVIPDECLRDQFA